MLGVENFDDREISNDSKFLDVSINKILELDIVSTPSEKLQIITQATKSLLSTRVGPTHFSSDDLTPLIIAQWLIYLSRVKFL